MSFPRYPTYKDSGVEWLGRVPGHWDVPPLYLRYEVLLGKMVDEKKLTGDNLLPYIRNVDVQWDEVNVSDLPQIDIAPHEKERFTLRKGDLLVCEGGEVGRAAIWRNESFECAFQKAIHRLRPISESEVTRFFYYCMCFGAAKEIFIAESNPNTIPHLTGEKFRRYRFPKPPWNEQAQIAAFLDSETAKIDALVAEQLRLIELLKEKRQAVISHAVTKGLNPRAPVRDSGIEWLGDVPAHWEVKRLQRCVYIAEGQVDPEDPSYSAMPLIAPNHIESGTGRLLETESAIEQGAESGKYLCQAGDVVYSKIRPALRKACIAPHACLCSADMYPMRAHSGLTNSFLLWSVLSEWFSAFAVLESQRVAMPKINRESLKEVLLPVPPIEEQAAIAKYIGSMTATLDALSEESRRAIDLLQERRTALISAAVTGQIDVRQLSEKQVAA